MPLALRPCKPSFESFILFAFLLLCWDNQFVAFDHHLLYLNSSSGAAFCLFLASNVVSECASCSCFWRGPPYGSGVRQEDIPNTGNGDVNMRAQRESYSIKFATVAGLV